MKTEYKCAFCGSMLHKTRFDGKTVYGSWADMCGKCFAMYGVGLGTGRGQKFERTENHWRKVAG